MNNPKIVWSGYTAEEDCEFLKNANGSSVDDEDIKSATKMASRDEGNEEFILREFISHENYFIIKCIEEKPVELETPVFNTFDNGLKKLWTESEKKRIIDDDGDLYFDADGVCYEIRKLTDDGTVAYEKMEETRVALSEIEIKLWNTSKFHEAPCYEEKTKCIRESFYKADEWVVCGPEEDSKYSEIRDSLENFFTGDHSFLLKKDDEHYGKFNTFTRLNDMCKHFGKYWYCQNQKIERFFVVVLDEKKSESEPCENSEDVSRKYRFLEVREITKNGLDYLNFKSQNKNHGNLLKELWEKYSFPAVPFTNPENYE